MNKFNCRVSSLPFVAVLSVFLLLAGCQTTSKAPSTDESASPKIEVPQLQPKVDAPTSVTPPPPVVLATPLESKPLNLKATFKPLNFSAIPGWTQDNLNEAWPAFIEGCKALINRADWRDLCLISQNIDAQDGAAIRHFFEAFFTPYQVINADGTNTGLITGYYEPLLQGSRKRTGIFQTPLYQAPADLLTIDMSGLYPELKGMRLRGKVVGNKVVPYPSRAELLQSNALKGKEICWVADSVDAFFLQVQGSGRVHFNDTKETIRVAYADQNGQPYRSIGRYLVDKGELKLEQASAQGIKNWIATHPEREDEVLNANPSYVFFKEEKMIDPNRGPAGALGIALTEQRSVAIDAQYLPLGAPIFINTTEPNSDKPLRRLMMAQDTGGAIRGAVRADFFWGFGDKPGEMAGRMKQRGMLWLLWPNSASAALGGIAK